jgi:hypothetical protein
MKRLKDIIIIILLLYIPCLTAQAQKVAMGTNCLEWGNFGTVNLETGFAVSQHISISAGARYNPWEFKTDNPHLAVQNKQQTFFTGVRYWPWYVWI